MRMPQANRYGIGIEMENSVSFRLFVVVVGAVSMVCLASGCSGIEPERMVPPSVMRSDKQIGQSVAVAEVTGGKESSFGGPAFINNGQFKRALVRALEKSNLFRTVSDSPSELNVYAAIRDQDQHVSRGLQYTATMVVTYRIKDRSGRSVWAKSYETEFSSVAFAGASRTIEAREGCVRQNIATFLNGLRNGLTDQVASETGERMPE